MIPVPSSALEALAASFGTETAHLRHFGGGEEASDGVVYAYPHQDTRRLLKILAIPAEEQRTGRLCLEERLKFVRFLGENGAHIVYPQFSPSGNLYETTLDKNYLWIGYSMELVPGRKRGTRIFSAGGAPPSANCIGWRRTIPPGKRRSILRLEKNFSPGGRNGKASTIGYRGCRRKPSQRNGWRSRSN